MTDNIKLPPMPLAFFDEFGNGADDRVQDYASEAVRLNAQAVPDGWVMVPIRPTLDMIDAGADCDPERESVWDAMLSAAPAAPAAPQPAHPLDLSVMELAESVGLIGPASRTDDLHEAIQRFHDLIVANASIKAALHFADGLAQPARQPLTDEQIKDIHWSKPMDEFQFARAIEQAHGIGVKND